MTKFKTLINDFNFLKNTAKLPPDSPYRVLTETICNLYEIDFNLKIGESWLQNEIFKRFLKTI